MAKIDFAKRYIHKDIRNVVDQINKRDGGVLKELLVKTMVDYSAQRFELDEVEHAKLLRWGHDIILARLGGKTPTFSPLQEEELPDNWKDIITPRKFLYSLKQLSEEEKKLHYKYCSKEKGCRFVANHLCPIAKGWMYNKK